MNMDVGITMVKDVMKNDLGMSYRKIQKASMK